MFAATFENCEIHAHEIRCKRSRDDPDDVYYPVFFKSLARKKY